MRVLSIETSSPHGSVALTDNGTVVAFEETREPNSHAETLSSAVRRLTAQAAWQPADVELVAVGRGPGSFTGLRVGIALAQGIGTGLGVPVVGVPSLAALARAVRQDIAGWRVATIDARRGELFVAVYGPDGSEIVPAALVARNALTAYVNRLESSAVVLCGAADAHEVDQTVHIAAEVRHPNALATAAIAAEWFEQRRPEAAQAVTPLYLREADAIVPELRPNPLLQAGAEVWQVGENRAEGSS